MSVADAEGSRHEIIIVRRGHDDHDEAHHGGVWKIAFADFMTAMMCFFLVMWLINAANEQTKAAVASYFNPVKLIDRNASRKGLEDHRRRPEQGRTDRPTTPTRTEPENPGRAGSGAAEVRRTRSSRRNRLKNRIFPTQQLFADPYAVLSEIATDTGVMQNVSQKGDGGAQNAGPANGASGGKSYRDPFAPDFWSQAGGSARRGGKRRTDQDQRRSGRARRQELPKPKRPRSSCTGHAARDGCAARTADGIRARQGSIETGATRDQGRNHEGRSHEGRIRQCRNLCDRASRR